MAVAAQHLSTETPRTGSAAPTASSAPTASVRRSAIVDAAPAEVYALVAGAAAFQSINPWRDDDPTLRIELFGPELGAGSGFRFKGRSGSGVQTVVETVADRRVVSAIDLGIFGTSRQIIDIAPRPDGGCDVAWTTELRPGWNPLARMFALFAGSVLGPLQARGLANIADRLAR